jgi:hypothetical protein
MTLTLERTTHEPPDTSAVTLQDVKAWEQGLLVVDDPDVLYKILCVQRQHVGTLAMEGAEVGL